MMSQALPALCWMTFTFLVSDCSHAQLLEARECQASAETAVRHQPKLCKASAEHVLSCFSRNRTKSGADGRIRTGDPLFTKQLLCQLSYVGVRTDYMRGLRPARKGSLRSGD